jgi:hypothetical protein
MDHHVVAVNGHNSKWQMANGKRQTQQHHL